ncbi:hypothetical protein DR46_12100 [Salmonella enterica]|nr:hypothetical protein [Salmonella enterica]EGI5258356.1 hypothetical protein [Salmonella enterica subsp. enterica serovar Weltevreden]
MAWTSGTAANERELLTALNDFLTTSPELVASGENWQQIYSGTIAATETTAPRVAYAWVAPGSAAADQIYVAARTSNSIADDIYNVYFAGGTWFSPGAVTSPDTFWSSLTNPSSVVGLCADAGNVRYWFIASGRRFIVITSINTVYSSVYCGFMLPAVTPDEYPYPLVIAGSTDSTLRRYSLATDYNTSISDPRSKNCWLMYPDQGWRDFYGHAAVSYNTGGTLRYLTPRGINRYNSNGATVMQGMGPTPDSGSFPLIPVEFRADESHGRNHFGAMDGVYWLPGLSRAAEDLIDTPDGRQFLVVQNAFRVNTFDYFAVELA